jgi:hypothetical protein
MRCGRVEPPVPIVPVESQIKNAAVAQRDVVDAELQIREVWVLLREYINVSLHISFRE